jgi:hypothetical protein
MILLHYLITKVRLVGHFGGTIQAGILDRSAHRLDALTSFVRRDVHPGHLRLKLFNRTSTVRTHRGERFVDPWV